MAFFYRLSCLVSRISYQANTGKKENSAQDRIDEDHSDALTSRPAVCKANSSQNKPDHPNYGQDDS